MYRTISIVQLVSILFLIPFSGCSDMGSTITGSGTMYTQSRSFIGFTKIRADSKFKVDAITGATYSISVRSDDNLLPYLQIVPMDGELYLGLNPNYHYEKTKLSAVIITPSIRELNLSGMAESNILFGEDADDIKIICSGQSKATITGQARNLIIEASGKSKLELSEFKVKHADIRLSGGSQASIQVTDSLKIDLQGSSILTYKGTGKIESKTIAKGSTLTKGK